MTTPGCCDDGTCRMCGVKETGARRLLLGVGEDYDAENPVTQHHFRELCGSVYSVMSDALLESGLLREKT